MHPRPRLLALVAVAVVAPCAVVGARLPAAPVQPIRFSHEIHAGESAIGCLYCHAFAERSPVAGIPSMARCQGCHKFVKEDKEKPTVTEEIKALLKYLEDERPIAWVRVYRLPDHVYFTHQRHVLAGLQCRDCHGEVEKMAVMRQVAPLTMGWCLECHKRKQAERPLERAHLTDCVNCHK